MKILTVKNVVKTAAIVLSSTATFAVVSLSDPNVIGSVSKQTPANDDTGADFVNYLLSLTVATPPAPTGTGLIAVSGIPGNHVYVNLNPGFTGEVSTVGDLEGSGTSVPAGFDVVLAKYGNDGIAFFLNGAAFDLPATLSGIFPSDGTGDNGGGLSGFIAYNGVEDNPVLPPEGAVPDGGATMLLLGGGVSALAFLRRKLS